MGQTLRKIRKWKKKKYSFGERETRSCLVMCLRAVIDQSTQHQMYEYIDNFLLTCRGVLGIKSRPRRVHAGAAGYRSLKW